MPTADSEEPIGSNISDYGSDLDAQDLDELFDLEGINPIQQPVLEDIEDHNHLPHKLHLLHVYKPNRDEASVKRRRTRKDVQAIHPTHITASCGESCREAHLETTNDGTQKPRSASAIRLKAPKDAEVEVPAEADTRSPLLRFRTAPRKPLSVTDLVSPAWCELQYWYSLTKYGRVKRTPAMKQGSSVHKVLEEQVHTTVPIDLVTREDAFGLRICNVVQGLRTIRATGMTREFEVWGIVDGQVINGVIDELNVVCPDKQLENKLHASNAKGKSLSRAVDPSQATLHGFLGNNNTSSDSGLKLPDRKVYLADVKTRGSSRVPSSMVSLRPSYMQLMLYHALLSRLAADQVDAVQIFDRYSLDGDAAFSDTFLAELGNMDFGHQDADGSDQLDELLAHNNLTKLWRHMIDEFEKTLPMSAVESSIGDVLRIEYRTSTSGAVLGTKTFAFEQNTLDAYVKNKMEWWKGERPASGVDEQEAFKCRMCEFSEVCTWRQGKVDQSIARARLRGAESKSRPTN